VSDIHDGSAASGEKKISFTVCKRPCNNYQNMGIAGEAIIFYCFP
jgi:hypothetical protein